MKQILPFLLVPLISFAIVPQETAECKALYETANSKWVKLQPILKMKIASKVAWDSIGAYLDAATETLLQCEVSRELNFRYVRELKQGMKRANKERYNYQVWTYESMVAKARSEGRCTNIYRSYGK